MAPSFPVSRAGLAAVHKVTKNAHVRTRLLKDKLKDADQLPYRAKYLDLVEGADQMAYLAHEMLDCGSLQVGLHVELDLTNSSISAREDVPPEAFMRSMGYVPVAVKPEAKEYLAAALAHLQKMSDPLPPQLSEAVKAKIEANNTHTGVYRDALNAFLSARSRVIVYGSV
ncbi:hypothetical protein PG985_005288 [Apiospora marii]|uniref:uncharacterized protein n=1 Tax=Apiospora marii TaxID=335849 RepID=UPI00312D50D8